MTTVSLPTRFSDADGRTPQSKNLKLALFRLARFLPLALLPFPSKRNEKRLFVGISPLPALCGISRI
jgi:hypothetical protein